MVCIVDIWHIVCGTIRMWTCREKKKCMVNCNFETIGTNQVTWRLRLGWSSVLYNFINVKLDTTLQFNPFSVMHLYISILFSFFFFFFFPLTSKQQKGHVSSSQVPGKAGWGGIKAFLSSILLSSILVDKTPSSQNISEWLLELLWSLSMSDASTVWESFTGHLGKEGCVPFPFPFAINAACFK